MGRGEKCPLELYHNFDFKASKRAFTLSLTFSPTFLLSLEEIFGYDGIVRMHFVEHVLLHGFQKFWIRIAYPQAI